MFVICSRRLVVRVVGSSTFKNIGRYDGMQLACVPMAVMSGHIARIAGVWMEHVAKGQFVYCTNVFTLPLSSGSAAQQPSYPCEAYAEQAQRKLPHHIQATVMVCAALAAC